MQDRLAANPKITVVTDSVVTEVLDVTKDEVTGLRIKNLKTDAVSTIDISAMFVAIGHTPLADLVKGQVDLHDNGYVKTTPGTTQTSVPGFFAAGDVQDFVFRQAVTAAGTGCMAALEAERFIAVNDH